MVECQVKEERLAGNGSVVGREGSQGHLPRGGRVQHKLVHSLTQWLQKHINHIVAYIVKYYKQLLKNLSHKI